MVWVLSVEDLWKSEKKITRHMFGGNSAIHRQHDIKKYARSNIEVFLEMMIWSEPEEIQKIEFHDFYKEIYAWTAGSS